MICSAKLRADSGLADGRALHPSDSPERHLETREPAMQRRVIRRLANVCTRAPLRYRPDRDVGSQV